MSVATASRVLNGSARSVGPELRDRVLAVASDLHYVPNAHAQAVARRSSTMVGLVVHDIADPYFSAIAAGVMRTAAEHSLAVMVGSTQRRPDLELDYVSMLFSQRPRAVVIAGSRSTEPGHTQRLAEQIEAFRESGGRVACISQSALGTDTVEPQNRAGAQALARALVQLGHRRFAVLAGPPDLVTARDRAEGFIDAVMAAGTPPEDVTAINGAFTRDGGYAAVSELADGGLRASCVFAVNDVMAVGAMAALREREIRVPEDVSVAGFDDIQTLRDVVPALTTVRLPLEEMGLRAATMALDGREGDRPRIVHIRGEVIFRDSAQAPSAGWTPL